MDNKVSLASCEWFNSSQAEQVFIKPRILIGIIGLWLLVCQNLANALFSLK
jgi:hypothetical protein